MIFTKFTFTWSKCGEKNFEIRSPIPACYSRNCEAAPVDACEEDIRSIGDIQNTRPSLFNSPRARGMDDTLK